MITLSTTLDKFITDNYNEIVHIARRITKTSSHHVYEELAHVAIESFIQHKRAEELIEKKQAFLFLSGIMHRNYYSSTSPWHKVYRYAGKEVPLKTNIGYVSNRTGDLVPYEDVSNLWIESKEHMYNVFNNTTQNFKDYEAKLEHSIDGAIPEDFNHAITKDMNLQAIEGIMEDMEADTVEQWFRVKLFKMWLEQPNYSELSRITGIPRTSISQAVSECREYIKNRIEQWR